MARGGGGKKKFDLSGVQPSGERLSFSHRTQIHINSYRFQPPSSEKKESHFYPMFLDYKKCKASCRAESSAEKLHDCLKVKVCAALN